MPPQAEPLGDGRLDMEGLLAGLVAPFGRLAQAAESRDVFASVDLQPFIAVVRDRLREP